MDGISRQVESHELLELLRDACRTAARGDDAVTWPGYATVTLYTHGTRLVAASTDRVMMGQGWCELGTDVAWPTVQITRRSTRLLCRVLREKHANGSLAARVAVSSDAVTVGAHRLSRFDGAAVTVPTLRPGPAPISAAAFERMRPKPDSGAPWLEPSRLRVLALIARDRQERIRFTQERPVGVEIGQRWRGLLMPVTPEPLPVGGQVPPPVRVEFLPFPLAEAPDGDS